MELLDNVDYNKYNWDLFFLRTINGNTYLCPYNTDLTRPKRTYDPITYQGTPNRQTYIKDYYEANKAEFKARQKKYYYAHREEILKKRKQKREKI
jgi:hypothetical protein